MRRSILPGWKLGVGAAWLLAGNSTAVAVDPAPAAAFVTTAPFAPLSLSVSAATADSLAPPALHPGRWLGPGADRAQHATLSLAITVGAGAASDSRALALGSAVAIGIAKELRDAHVGHGFDWMDLVADGVGAGLGWMLLNRFAR